MKNPHNPDMDLGIGRGRGSQPPETDGSALSYLAMPDEMTTYSPPLLPDEDRSAPHGRAVARLREVQHLLASYRPGDPSCVIDLVGLGPDERKWLDDVLGEGEVSARFADGEAGARIQETRLAGVWRVLARGPHGNIQRDTLEVTDVPAILRHHAFDRATTRVDSGGAATDGVMNALPVLTELADRAASWRLGEPCHVINLTLLPVTAEDVALLHDRLGRGDVTLLSRGYGNCRITATGLRHVWWVKYFNSEDALILDTLEVVDIPAVVLAAPEDLADSAERLAEILETVG